MADYSHPDDWLRDWMDHIARQQTGQFLVHVLPDKDGVYKITNLGDPTWPSAHNV